MNRRELVNRCGCQRLHRSEMAHQHIRHSIADMPNSQSGQQTIQSLFAASFDRVNHILRALFPHPFQFHQLFFFQSIHIRKRLHQSGIDHLIDQRFTDIFNIHLIAAAEPFQLFTKLRRTIRIDTSDIRAVFILHHFPSAGWAFRGRLNNLCSFRSIFKNHLTDIRNHFARLFHDNGITVVNIQSPNLIDVMQRRIGYGGPR